VPFSGIRGGRRLLVVRRQVRVEEADGERLDAGTRDRDHDEEDRRAGRQVTCPTMILWALQDDMELLYGDPLAVWRGWVERPFGQALDCGHHIAEEAPEELAALIIEHLAS